MRCFWVSEWLLFYKVSYYRFLKFNGKSSLPLFELTAANRKLNKEPSFGGLSHAFLNHFFIILELSR